jgi:ATP-dependent Clp protease ATP-binding subunit ClpA
MALNNAFDSAGTESRAEVEEARKKIRKEEEQKQGPLALLVDEMNLCWRAGAPTVPLSSVHT